MEFRTLGRSGLKVSAVGLGCNNFGMTLDQAGTQRVVDKALDLGITLFDTADGYGEQPGSSETFLGKSLGTRRSQALIATKFGLPTGQHWTQSGGASRGYMMRALEGSLRRLGTDYIDLYQVHMADPTTPMEETLRALDDAVSQGKVRYIGVSNHSVLQVVDAAWIAKTKNLTPFVSSQNRYSVLTRLIEPELVPACQAHGFGILPFFPLEGGVLTGKYKDIDNPPAGSRAVEWKRTGVTRMFMKQDFLDKSQKLAALAAETGDGILDLAVGWLLSKPYVSSVIAGATKPEQLEANVKAAAWRPTVDQSKRIDEISPAPNNSPFV